MEFLLEGIAPFKMLLGQDIIGRGKLTLSFYGYFTFTLRKCDITNYTSRRLIAAAYSES